MAPYRYLRFLLIVICLAYGLEVDASWKFAHTCSMPDGMNLLLVEGKKITNTGIILSPFQSEVETPWCETWWFNTGIILFVLISIVMGFRLHALKIREQEKGRTKQFKRVVGLKIRALQYQLDPHFIFNSLNSIQGYILEGSSERALEYLSDFSMILRKNINNANKDFIQLSDEIYYLEHYLKLEQMRFSDKFTFKFKLDPHINPSKIKLPPMLIQPFLENAIKYGLAGLNEKGELSLEFELEEDGYLKCIITDNGIGRQKAKSLHEYGNIQAHHKTLQITRDRMKLLNKVYKNGRMFAYSVQDLVDKNNVPCGTRVEIGFPKIH